MPMAIQCSTASKAATGSFWGGTLSATTCIRPTRRPWHPSPLARFPDARAARPCVRTAAMATCFAVGVKSR